VFAVTDFKVSAVDVELRAGYGFTPGSGRFVLKVILGYAFPVSGESTSDNAPNAPLGMGTWRGRQQCCSRNEVTIESSRARIWRREFHQCRLNAVITLNGIPLKGPQG
jgi:hypothetical protein